MRQKPAYEQLQQRFHLDSCKELDPPLNKRFSLNLPDCSAVLDSQNNLMDTNEISWLEKFAEENQKICNSGLFDDAPPAPAPHPVPTPANDMKFSFNMNYHHEDRRRDDNNVLGHQSSPRYAKYEGRGESPLLARDYSAKKIVREDTQNVLADIQNTQAVTKRARKESLPGSIKKNQKAKASLAIPEISEYQREVAESLPYNRLQEMNERLSKVLHHERSSYIQQIANKQNAKLYSEVSMTNLLSPTPSANTLNSKFENTLKQHRRAREIPSILPLERSSSMNADPVKPATPRYEYTAALEALFNRLDKSQTGKLSRFNCDTEGIPEDFKFIFGGVFTSIRLKQYTCNRRQFVQSCEKTVKLLESSEAVDLLRAFEEKERSSLGGEKVYERNKSPFKASFFEEKASLTSYIKQGPQSSLMKEVKSSSKALESVCQCRSNIQIKVDENTNDSSRAYHKSSLNPRKYSQILQPSKAKSALFAENPTYYPKKSYQKESYQANQSQFRQDSSRKHGSSISESVIQDHKKSLQNLKKLNQRMQFCLSTNLLSEHSKPGLSRQDSLTFDELIKHV